MSLFKRKETQKVYCQNCSEDITEDGGYVTSDGKIYCLRGYRSFPIISCVERAALNSLDMIFANYHNPKEVQKDIRKGKLTFFNPLEKSVSN